LLVERESRSLQAVKNDFRYENMRVAVFGTGGVGGYFGGRLAQGGEDVTFIARGEHLRAMQTSANLSSRKLAPHLSSLACNVSV
jgi:ketopantoate reductase